MRVTLTGRVALHGEDGAAGGAGLGAPAQLACAYLVLERRPVSRDELADLLWGDELPRSWKQLVRGVIAQIRAAFREAGVSPIDALTTAFSCYQIHLPPGTEVDVEQAGADLAAAEAAMGARNARRSRELAAAAVGVAARRLLPAANGDWVEGQQAQLRETHLRALDVLAASCLADGDVTAAIDAAEAAIAIEPYRESAYVALMHAHAAAGNRAQALGTYERCRARLREELGVTPSPATETLYIDLLGTEPAAPELWAADDHPNGAPRLPLSLEAMRRGPFVGRGAELGAVLEALADRGPSLVSVLIGGEAGVGKTRLAAEAAAAVDRRTVVFHGSCDRMGGRGFEPFADIADGLINLLGAHHVPVPAPDELARLVPGLAEEPREVGTAATDAERARTVFFDAVVALLTEAAAIRPLLIVMDDVQWASVPTLLLLRHLLRTAVGVDLAIIATFRDRSPQLSETLVELLGEVTRSGSIRRLQLGGLDVDAVGEFISIAGAEQVQTQAMSLAPTLHQTTGGNPLFIREVVRHWNDGGTGVPPVVADAVQARLLPLPVDARQVLTLAAVVGSRFDLWSLAQLSDLGDEVILVGLEQAASSGLVVELRDELDRWRFSHDLVRDALAETVSAARRARFHTQLGLALASRGDPAVAGDIAARLLAGTADHRAGAVDWLVVAAERSQRELAFESAVAYYQRAIAALDADPATAPERRFELQLALGHALRRTGLGAEARAALLEAVDLARQLPQPEALASAAVAVAARSTPKSTGRPSPSVTALLKEALQRLPEASTRARAQLLSHLAIQRQLGDDFHGAEQLIAEAQRLVTGLHDPAIDLMANALLAGEAADPIENLKRGRRWLDAALRAGDSDHEAWARITIVWAAISSGHFAEARDGATAFEQRARQLRQLNQLWWPTVWDVSRAITEGRFGDAIALIDEASLWDGAPEGMSSAVQVWFLQLSLQRLTGNINQDLVAELDRYRRALDNSSRLAALDLWVRWHAGHHEAITARLRTADPLALLNEHGGNQLAYAGMLAEVAASAALDPAVLHSLYHWLRPFAGRYLVIGYCGALFGSVDRSLGLLALATGQNARARAHLDQAVRSFSANNATPWTTLTSKERELAASSIDI